MNSTIRAVLGAVFTAAFGAWLFKANLTTDDTGIVVGLIVLGSAVAAAILPARWWPAASLIGLCVIASEVVRRDKPMDPGFFLVAVAILAFSLAGIGASLGARRLWGAKA